MDVFQDNCIMFGSALPEKSLENFHDDDNSKWKLKYLKTKETTKYHNTCYWIPLKINWTIL